MTIEFASAADQWLESRCYQTPSALHGWLVGFLASGARLTAEAWIGEAQDYLELEENADPALAALLLTMYEEMLASLSAEDMTFQPLLPEDDDADVDEQVDCLAEWSKGFLDGFGASGLASGKLPDDVVEVLRDLDAFSQATIDDPQDPQNPQLYLALTEHARVAALTVFYAFNKPAESAPGIVH